MNSARAPSLAFGPRDAVASASGTRRAEARHPLSRARSLLSLRYSFFNATVVSLGGALSSFLGGRAADRWEKAGNQRARLHVPAIGVLFGIPCAAFMLVSSSRG